MRFLSLFLIAALCAVLGTSAHAEVFTVTSTADTDGSTCGTTCTLRQAINAANGAAGANSIVFDSGTFGAAKQTITLTTNLPVITNDVSIIGPNTSGAGVTLDNPATSYSTLNVASGTVSVSNLALLHGYHGVTNQGGNVTITGCTFTINGASSIYNVGGVLDATNCTVAGDTSDGIETNGGTSTYDSCTITGSGGDGVYAYGTGTLNLRNSIVAGNRANTFVSGSVTFNQDHNLLANTAANAGLTVDGNGNAVLADNGGPTQTVALVVGGAAVDAGATALTVDQRGFKRPKRNGVDIGAFELNEAPQSGANFVVNQTDDHNDGVCGPTDCTLREAIGAANGNSDTSQITFDPTVFATRQTIALNGRAFISSDLSITAPPAGLILSSASANPDTVLQVQSGTVSLAGLTLAGNTMDSLYLAGGAATVSGCTFSGDKGDTAFIAGGTHTITNCTCSQDFAGIRNGGGTVTVDSCTLVGNFRPFSLGSGTTYVNNCLIAGSAEEFSAGTPASNTHNYYSPTTTGIIAPNGLQDNGGPTQTIALLAGSPAIDKGNTALKTDARGLTRPVDLPQVSNASGGNGSDIGAYEKQAASGYASGPDFVVTNTGDTDNGCTPTNCSLREAINAANSSPDTSKISFDATVFTAPRKTIALSGRAAISSNLSITAPSAGVILSSASANPDTVLQVISGTVSLSGLTFAGNTSDGLYLNGGAVAVNTCTFSGDADSSILNSGANSTVSNCTFVNAHYSIRVSSGTLSADSCTLVGDNGGFFLEGGTTKANNCLIAGTSKVAGGVALATDTNNYFGPVATAGLDSSGLQDNGGPTQTVALTGSSPAINAGSTTLTVDQRGVTRPSGSAADIGAFEFVQVAPTVVSVTPQGASDKVGAKRTFTLTMSDANGASDLREMWLLINTQLDWSAGATLIYRPSTTSPTDGQLFLRRGDDFLPPITIGTGASSSDVLDNGAVRIVATDVTASVSGNNITLTLPVTIRDGLVGQNTLFARAQDSAGAVDPAALAGEFGFVREGSYTVTPQFTGAQNSAPTLSNLNPSATNTTLSGSGLAPTAQNFGFFVQDADGTGDLDSIWFLAGPARDWAHSATFVYYPRTRRLVLRSDDGQSFLGGGQIGSAGILENSQVRVDLSKVKLLIYSDGKSLGLSLPLQAKTGLVGQNGVWLRVQDRAGATSPDGDDLGFARKGNWNVKAGSVASPNAAPSNGNS